MTAYRELVNRVLAVKQAGLEMGLAKAREQEGFIRRVAALLDKTSWAYVVRMDKDFGVGFCVETGLVGLGHQVQAVRQALAAEFDVAVGMDCCAPLTVAHPLGHECTVVFGEAA